MGQVSLKTCHESLVDVRDGNRHDDLSYKPMSINVGENDPYPKLQ